MDRTSARPKARVRYINGVIGLETGFDLTESQLTLRFTTPGKVNAACRKLSK